MSSGRTLAELSQLPCIDALQGDGDVRVEGVRTHSGEVQKGDLFAAIVGASQDATRFVDDAVERGAVAVLTQKPVSASVPVLSCSDVREALGSVAHAVYDNPTAGWPVIGVTGTNGKTTVTYLVEAILSRVWGTAAVSGTVEMRGPASVRVAGLTTPEADALARFARGQRDAGATALIMEASSIALAQGRLNGIQFEVAAYTNLTQDHLDFHGDMQAYGATKERLFTELAPRHSVVCVDDAFGRTLAQRATGRVLRCSSEAGVDADVGVSHWQSSRSGLSAMLRTPMGDVPLISPLIGRHNLQNLCVAMGIACALGIDARAAASALGDARGAPGRMERVDDPRGVAIFVDYAHTPDAVARALEALRPITDGRVFIVVGCGGDRDAAKRAPMGIAAVRGADVALLTSDNPRTEPPDAILEQMRQGALGQGATALELSDLPSAAAGYVCEVDRARAIEAAVRAARPGDTILIAGKGHEDYQIVGTVKRPFDDREHARAAVERAGEG